MTSIQSGPHCFEWFSTGFDLLEAKLLAIAQAQHTVRLETYIYANEDIGHRFRQALVEAGKRGVQVWLLVDAVGGMDLKRNYFAELATLPGCAMKWFNEPSLATWSFRDHRKLLIIDSEIAFVGGCNIAEDYHGDGVTKGWRDGGMRMTGPVAKALEAEYDAQFATAHVHQWKVLRAAKKLRGPKPIIPPAAHGVKPLFIRPGFGDSPLRTSVREDLKNAKEVCITSAYFLPSRSLRRQLGSAVGRGTSVRLLIGGKSDVKLMQLATRSLYQSLVDAGIRIYEYMPQVLHAKMLIIDDVVYMGSSNLDPRSLRINFEVMVRVESADLAKVARQQFEADLVHSEEITSETCWEMNLWERLKQKLAHWILARVDPRMSEGFLRRLQSRV